MERGLHAPVTRIVSVDMKKNWIACIAVATTLPHLVIGQEKAAPTYRLHFRMHESRGETNETTRDYILVVQAKTRGKINASRRIPYYTSSKGEAKELHTAALGSIIECTPDDAEAGLRLQCAFESSSVAPGQLGRQSPVGFLPIVNSRQVSTVALIPIGAEVQLAVLDDPSTGSRLEVSVSAERITGPAGSPPTLPQ